VVHDRTTVVVKPAERDPAAWGDALCNDGTPFAYRYRPGAEGSRTWVVHLSGGAFCDELRNPCHDRERRLTTTRPEADGEPARDMRRQGLLSTDPTVNPTFADAHHVDAHYCSSDLWLGDRPERRDTTGSPEGWHFAGRHHVAALVSALPRLHGLDPSTDAVLFVGTSAGGAGVVGNVDQLVEAWPQMVAAGRLKALIDGAWVADLPEGTVWPDVDRWGPAQPACARALEAAGRDPVHCVEGPEWWPYVQALGVPVLVQISGADTFQTTVLGIDEPAEKAAWRATVHRSLQSVDWAFSAASAYHIVAVDPRFGKGRPGKRFVDLLDAFWKGEPAQRWLRGYDPSTEPPLEP
jgi:hypothetical protein